MVDWLNLSESSGSGYQLVSVTALPNYGSARTTTLVVSGHTASTTIEVEQELFINIIEITPSSTTFTYTGGTQAYSIYSNYNWNITSYPNWLSFDVVSGSSGTTVITATAAQNYTSSALSSSFVVSGLSTSSTVTVNQDAFINTVSITPSAYTFSYTGGTHQFTIESNYSWNITSYPNWLSLSALSGDSGTTIITATASTNSGYTSYTSDIVVSSLTSSASASITLEGRTAVLSISPASYTYPYSGGTKTFNVSHSMSWDVVSYPSWLTIDKHTDYINTTASTNASISGLSSAIVISGEGATASADLYQEGTPVVITLSNSSFNVPYTGGTYLFTVTSNVPWSSSTSSLVNASIIPVTGGTGTTTVTLDVSANTTTDILSETFYIFGEGKIVPAYITQGVAPSHAYLMFTIISGGTITWESKYPGLSVDNKIISYRKNGGEWVSITGTSSTTETINVSNGDYLEFKGDNASYGGISEGSIGFGGTATFDVSGNIMSLIDSVNFSTLTGFSSTRALQRLFSGSNVRDASGLIMPAMTLTRYCYNSMFEYCEKLITAPELPAATLQNYSYFHMFYGCISLNYVKCLATSISATTSTNQWLYDVASTGTFVKASSMSGWPSGDSGIPSGWSVQNA